MNEIIQDDCDRNEIRQKLSNMSFEDLMQLKQKLGSKIYKEAVYGEKSNVSLMKFKRKNKNRPKEVSSKIKPVHLKRASKKNIIDPRFNRLYGTFNRKHFENTYGFLFDMRKNEKHELKRMLDDETNPKEIEKIKYLIQRIENQELEEKKRKGEKEKHEQERQEQILALESGKKPHFKTKYEKKVIELIDKYSTLKKSGKIQKYIERKQKKQNVMEKKKLRYFDTPLCE